jgi:sec-independent protein translocase protein TatA
MFGIGMQELVILLVLGLLLFGSKLPDFARYLGQSVSVFRREIGGLSDDLNGPTR